MKIAYLNPDASSRLEDVPPKVVIGHPDSIIYSLEDFVTAFNHEEISDMGYIALIKNLNMEKMLVDRYIPLKTEGEVEDDNS